MSSRPHLELGSAALGAALLTSACIPPEFPARRGTQLPAPGRYVPNVDARTPVPGTTRVLLDSVGDPARVQLVRATTDVDVPELDVDVPGGETHLCVTPCAVDLPPGQFTLRFSRGESQPQDELVELTVGEDPLVYRRVLRTEAGGSDALQGLGYGVYTIGGWAFWISLVATATDEDREAKDWVFVATSGAVSLLGAWVMKQAGPAERPGNGTTFGLPRR